MFWLFDDYDDINDYCYFGVYMGDFCYFNDSVVSGKVTLDAIFFTFGIITSLLFGGNVGLFYC